MIPAGFKIERIDDRRITVWKDDFGGYGATKDDKFSIASAVLYELADALLREDAQPAQSVVCDCGDEYPADSYGAGYIHGYGHCQNCAAYKLPAQSADSRETP